MFSLIVKHCTHLSDILFTKASMFVRNESKLLNDVFVNNLFFYTAMAE